MSAQKAAHSSPGAAKRASMNQVHSESWPSKQARMHGYQANKNTRRNDLTSCGSPSYVRPSEFQDRSLVKGIFHPRTELERMRERISVLQEVLERQRRRASLTFTNVKPAPDNFSTRATAG
jgi:hypothetical protein